MTTTSQQICKVVLVGETQTGKTSIIAKLTKDIFQEEVGSTIVNSITNYKIELEDTKTVQLVIWDTAGQEKYRSLNTLFYKDAVIVVLVYDQTQRKTFEEVKNYWIPQIRSHCGEKIIVAVAANKSDLFEEQEVSDEEGKQLAEATKGIFMQTSCKTGSGIKELFLALAKKYEKGETAEKERIILEEKKTNKIIDDNKKSCC